MNYLRRRIGNRKSSSQWSSDKNATQNKLVLFGNPAKRFDWEDVKRAHWEVLGEGTVGMTYKVDLEDESTTVVVKTLNDVVLSAEDFQDKVEALGAMEHENLLPLRGYYYSKDEKLLLYDYMPLGSLSSQLHRYRESGGTPLSWHVRLSIALGAARAIEHLHAQRRPNDHHGNIKSSNVLLTPSYEARVSDCGLALLARSSLSGGAHPTMADVYGFGVLLLELLTGKLHTQPHLWEEGVDLPAWVQSVAREEWTAQVLDEELPTIHDDVVQEIIELLEVAMRCVSSNPNRRPWMSDVRKKMEELCSHGGQQDGDSQSDEVSEGTNRTSSWLIPSAQGDRDSQLDQFSEGTKDTSSWVIPSAQEDRDSQLDQFSEGTKDTSSWVIPSAQEDRDSQLDQFSEGTKDTSSWLIPSAQEDRDSQLDQFSELSNDMYTRTPPDGVLEVSERVYVFDCCLTVDGLSNKDHQILTRAGVGKVRQHFPDAIFKVFNFGEQESQSQISEVLPYMRVVNYPIHHGGCPILTMEMIHLFLRSADAWLSSEDQRCMLVMHCERGGWPVLAFMLAALLLYRTKSNSEEETLHWVYKKAPFGLLRLISPLNPLPSQLRYFRYMSKSNVHLVRRPPDKALTLDSVILRSVPCLDAEVGRCLMFKIFGQDPRNLTYEATRVLGKDIRHYKQGDCKLVKVDIHWPVQGDVVLECMSLDAGLEHGETMFRVAFNTAYLLENILMLGLDQMDVPWDRQSQYSRDFGAEITFYEMNPAASRVSIDSSGDEEQTEIQIAKRAKRIEAQEVQVEDQEVYSALLSRDANTSHKENEVRKWPIQPDTAFPTSILLPTLSSQLEASVNLAHDGSSAGSDFSSFSLSQDGSLVSFSATLTKKNIKPLQSLKQQLISYLELSLDVPWVSVDSSGDEEQTEIQTAKRDEKIEAQGLQVEDQAVYSALLSQEEQTEIQTAKRDEKIEAQDLQVEDQAVSSALLSQDANTSDEENEHANTSDEENELQEWPIHSNAGFLTSILLPMLSTQSQASVNSAHDGSTTFSDSASSLLSQDGYPVSFSATLTKKNIKPLQSPKQQLVSSLELHQDVACVSVDSLQVEDQAVYNSLLSQDANTSDEENELREWPIQSNSTFPTSVLLPTLSSQSEVPVHSTLDESIASSDSASSSLCQDGSPLSFSATLTNNKIEPLQSPNLHMFSALELSQDVHSGESIQFHGWKEGKAAVTATNFDITCGRECASSSAVSSDSIEATEDLILSRASSSASMSSGFHYDVFLSFRGPDTRSGITDFLYISLVAAGIHTYRDADELRIGEEIGPELLKAINHSKISVPIFSKGYAFSKWCLNELVQMVECRKSRRQKIMPIFYDVTPSEVRHQTGSYGDAFVSHEKQFDNEVISKWKAALKEVGDLKGWDIDSMTTRREGELVNHIVQKVVAELKKAYLLVTDCLVGVEHHVKEIKRMVCGDSEDIQILGIHGMGGVGKTTLAKIIYNHLSYRFEDCCFISNVRETSQLKGIECLQNQLLSDILKRNWSNISNVDDGIKKIKERLCGKKALVLLDDVDQRIHLNALMGRPVWFGKGSRIIITSRNMDVFNVPEVCCTYELTGMDFNESLQLFCKHAFGRDHPLDGYAAFSNKVVKMTGGLPLALEVVGSQLRGKSKEVWDVTLEKLEKVPHEEVKKKLKICYDALDYRQKQIFLDVARSYIGFDKGTVLPLWPPDLFPGEGLQILQQRSLIKVGEDNKLWMHIQLRDLARDIIREEGKMKLENRPAKGIMRKLQTF